MKKKISLKQLEVKSFVTNLEDGQKRSLKGMGGTVAVQDDTFYSCYAYVTCDIVGCVVDGEFTVSTDDISIKS